MFRWIAMICFAFLVMVILLHHVLFPCGYEKRFSIGSMFRKCIHMVTTLFLPQRLNWPGRFLKLAFLLGLLSFIVLFATGFGPLLFGWRLQGWLLMIHASFAPVLIACAAAAAILGAGRFAFLKKDVEQAAVCRLSPARCCWLTDSGLGAKAGFWMLLFLSLPLTLTMVLSMLPWLGEDWQNFMFHAHRWSALAFALTAMLEFYMLARLEIRRDLHGMTD